jgi:Limiting CO2-inducible proteins B/C beta carbonyic anhydrases
MAMFVFGWAILLSCLTLFVCVRATSCVHDCARTYCNFSKLQLIVYGPHCGVDSSGKVGIVHRRGGRAKGEACCGSAVAAFHYVQSVMDGTAAKSSSAKGAAAASVVTDPKEAQQTFVGKLLLPYGKRLQAAKDPMVELPYDLFEAQDELMLKIVQKASKLVAGKIALLGGIQVNCDSGISDYFLPLRFEIFNNEGRLLMDLLNDK